MNIRTYWFPGEFYEANPESSARYTRTITLHVEADSPPFCPWILAAQCTRRRAWPPRSDGLPVGAIPNWRERPRAAPSMVTPITPSGGLEMESNDKQQNGPEEQPTGPTEEQPTGPTEEQPPPAGPQAPTGETPGGETPGGPPRRRLTRSREDRMIAGVCGGFARYFNIDPVFTRIAAVALAFVGGAGLLLYLAALLLLPSDEGDASVAASGEGRNRVLVIVGVGALLLVAWPFLLGGGLLLAGVGIPVALLVGAGVLVWWLVSGEGPSGDAGQVAKRAALGIGVLVLCCILFFGGAIAAAAGPDWLA